MMYRSVYYHLYTTIIILCIFLIFQQPLFAGLNVNPVVVEVVVPKEGITQVIKVGNTGEKPIRVRAELNKLRKGDRDINDWFIMIPRELELKPGETKDFSYVITPPEDAEGELRCMIFFVADELGEKKSMFGIRFGVPVYAIVKETVNLDAEVDKISVNYNQTDKKLKGIVYIKNKGNIHIRPFVNIDILDRANNVINSFEIPFGQPAQVGQNRPFMFNQKLELSLGSYKLIAKVDFGRMYGLKDYIATKEVEFEVKPLEIVPVGVEVEKVETESDVSEKVGGGK